MNDSDMLKYAFPFAIDLTVASVGAAYTDLWIEPDDKMVWLVLYAMAYQTSGGARAAVWCYRDVDTPAGVNLTDAVAALASATAWPFTLLTPTGSQIIHHPIPCHGTTRNLGFRWTALGAGENGYIKGIGLKLPLGKVY